MWNSHIEYVYFEDSFVKQKRDGMHTLKKEKKTTRFDEIKFVMLDVYITITGVYNEIKFKSI